MTGGNEWAACSGELQHLSLLYDVDDLTARVRRWVDGHVGWEPAVRARGLARQVLDRVQTLRVRLETPLVVATFGGTGTGKSTLVNALVGQEATASGRQRPTTITPVLLVHPGFELRGTRFEGEDFVVRRVDAPVLRELILIDCPDPDTSEGAEPGSNLSRLRAILPHCDVLLYVSTQQKYRSARISEELLEAAAGCRIVFVQTHADQDVDIREDWMRVLSERYQVTDMFFVDSRLALQEQQRGVGGSGEFGRLQQLLSSQLGAARRVSVRRANLLDLLEETLRLSRQEYDQVLPEVERLKDILQELRREQLQRMSSQLAEQLLQSRSLWERRLLEAVTERWGFSPFSGMLRFYTGFGSLLASLSFFRARTTAQVALIGAVQSARWLRARAEEQTAESGLERVAQLGPDDSQLQEARLRLAGYVRSAQLEADEFSQGRDLQHLRQQALLLEERFLSDARRAVDEVIGDLAARHSGFGMRAIAELVFLTYPLFVLLRMGHNFFWSSFLAPIVGARAVPEPLLTIDFYIPAVFFLIFWSGLLLLLFIRQLQSGLNRRIRKLSDQLAVVRLSDGLFPGLEEECRRIGQEDLALRELTDRAEYFRRRLAETGSLPGGLRR
ncbi:MAG: GTPase [Planctomycetota bacterium]